jgi:hypothetical protein
MSKPNTGARALIAVRAPIRRSPYGEFRKPFTPCHTAPPIAYEQKDVSVYQKGEAGVEARDPKSRDPKSRDLKRKGVGERNQHTPIQKAPPKSFNATQGHGSRV